MKISHSSENNIAVLTLEGNLTIGVDDDAFSDRIERVLAQGTTVIVVDLEHVEFIDSTGLGSLVRSHHRATQAGGELRLANVSFQLWNLIKVAHLTEVIQIFENRPLAIRGRGDNVVS